MIGTALFWADTSNTKVQFLHGLIIVVLPYLGLMLGARKGEWLEPAKFVSLFQDARPQKRYKILDTSVIIDGRVADIVETGFLDGTLVVPQFVLKELQFVADSSDPLKRNRGRRGLDILHRIQKMAGVEVVISDMDFPQVKEVDLKLIELARSLLGRIVTNDFNLNKVAQLRGVEVLNINELANALKPVVLPGEVMNVFILKEGKEYNQGVAYLDDGTMVVVDNARHAHRQEPRHRRHQRAADDGRPDDLRPARRGGAMRRRSDGTGAAVASAARTTPAAGRAPPHKRDAAAVPLVADGLLPDSGHRASTRSSWGSSRSSSASFDSQRPLGAPVRAAVGAGDSGRRAACGSSSPAQPLPPLTPELRLRRQSLELLRHADPVHGAAAPAADHGQGGARLRAVHRLAPARAAATCW